MTDEKLAEVRKEVRERERKRWKLLVGIFASVFATVAVNMTYTTLYQQEQNQNWCSLMAFLDDQNQAHPPTDPIAIEFATRVHTQREKLRCK